MIGRETDQITGKRFKSPLNNYQEVSENKLKDSDFAFSDADGLSYLCHKIKCLNRSRSYIDSPDWIKSNKTINPLRKYDDNVFNTLQYLH